MRRLVSLLSLLLFAPSVADAAAVRLRAPGLDPWPENEIPYTVEPGPVIRYWDGVSFREHPAGNTTELPGHVYRFPADPGPGETAWEVFVPSLVWLEPAWFGPDSPVPLFRVVGEHFGSVLEDIDVHDVQLGLDPDDTGSIQELFPAESWSATPHIVSFTASQTEILPGDPVLLEWDTESAWGQVRLLPIGPVGRSGQLTVDPLETTTYELRASNSNGTAVAAIEIVARPPTIDTFLPDDTAIAEGGSTVLRWQTGSTTSVVLSTDDFTFPVPPEGSQLVAPPETTVYTLHAINLGGETSVSVTVRVGIPSSPPEIEVFSATPPELLPGEPATLGWTTYYADEVEILGLGTVSDAGSQEVQPLATTDYTLRATNAHGTVEANLSVAVLPFRIERFSATPELIGRAETVTLEWEVSGSGSVAIEGLGPQAMTGLVMVGPDTDTTYRLEVESGNDRRERTATVRVGDFDHGALHLSWSPDGFPGEAPELEPHTEVSLYVLGESLDRLGGFEFSLAIPEGLAPIETRVLSGDGQNLGSGRNFLVRPGTCVDVGTLVPLVEVRLLPLDPEAFHGTAIRLQPPVGGTSGDILLIGCDGTPFPLATGEELPLSSGPSVPVATLDVVATVEGSQVRLRWNLPMPTDRLVLRRADLDAPLWESWSPEPVGEFVDPDAPREARYELHAWHQERYVGHSEVSIARDLPRASVLHPIRPNPFNPSTRIGFELAQRERVSLVVYDTAGRRVRTLLDGPLDAGSHWVDWDGRSEDGSGVASGTYFVRWSIPGQTRTLRATLLK